jgi:hypothetical protein
MSLISPSTACLAALSILIPKLSEAIRTNWRFEVVGEALDCLTDLLKELKGVVIKPEGHLDTVFMCMKMIFYKLVQLTQELEFIMIIFSNFYLAFFFSDAMPDNGTDS